MLIGSIRKRRRPLPPRNEQIRRMAGASYAGESLTTVDSDAGRIWVPATDKVMVPFLKQYKTWEPEEGAVLTTLGWNRMQFIDIGASFGYFTRLMAARFPKAKIDAFEPHPVIQRILALNVAEFGEQVTVWPTALGPTRSSVGLTTATHNIGDSRTWGDATEFSLVALQSIFDEIFVGEVDLVKIDVQGYETDVLAGMTRTLARSPAIRIVAEFWPSAIRDRNMSPENVLELHRSHGLTIMLLDGATPIHASDAQILEYCDSAGYHGQCNLLLLGRSV